MADAQLAARLSDKVAHAAGRSGAAGAWGFLKGFVKGALIAAAVIGVGLLIVGTGGLGAVAVGCLIGAVALGGVSGGLNQALTDTTPKPPTPAAAAGGPPCGTISAGSPDTKIENLPAARAGLDMTTHDGALVAQGSSTVAVNGKPLARINDQVACGGFIISASQHTTVGGPPATVVKIAAEKDTLWGVPVGVIQWGSKITGWASQILMFPVTGGLPAAIASTAGGAVAGEGTKAAAKALGASDETAEKWGMLGEVVGSVAAGKFGEGFGKVLPAIAGVTRPLEKGVMFGSKMLTEEEEVAQLAEKNLAEYCKSCAGKVDEAAILPWAEKAAAKQLEMAKEAQEKAFGFLQRFSETIEGPFKGLGQALGEKAMPSMANLMRKLGLDAAAKAAEQACTTCGEIAEHAQADSLVMAFWKSIFGDYSRSQAKDALLPGEKKEEKGEGGEGQGEGKGEGGGEGSPKGGGGGEAHPEP